MKKYIYIIILILIIIFIILNFSYKSNINILNDIIIFSLWDESKNEYVINAQKQENIQINVFKTIYNGNNVHKKIAPGSYGNFVIKFTKPVDSKCKIILNDITNKPKNLIFNLENKEYQTIKEMEEMINILFQTKNEITINWAWKYNSNSDLTDTNDGEKAQSYIFEIKAIV